MIEFKRTLSRLAAVLPMCYALTFLLSANISTAQNQSFAWTWEDGSKETGATSDFGQDGKYPGGRERGSMVEDINGNLWLFGGFGLGESFNIGSWLCDLWRYNPSLRKWEWVSGSKFVGSPGIYPPQGEPSIHAYPGARRGHAIWSDSVGNIWIFGGFGRSASTSSATNELNDLWKYNPNTGEWTWISGSNTFTNPGVYGTQGVPAASNTPGGREGMAYWKDASGNFWLMGGFGNGSLGSGELNDLWRFNPNTLEWTWMKGSTTPNAFGVYGTQGVANAANNPGGRLYAMATVDDNGDVWLFGGEGEGASTSNGYLSDLWKYDPSNNRWTWVHGSNQINGFANYGTQGVSSTSNNPGARFSGNLWTDDNGNLWLFGGEGYIASGTPRILNDTWRYNFSNGIWTWMKGSTTGNGGDPGDFRIDDPATTLYRARGSIGCSVSNGDYWMLRGRESTSSHWYGSRLYRFDVTTDNWTWMEGPEASSFNGIYGSTASSPFLIPGAREGHCLWADSLGNVWMFGGQGIDGSGTEGYLNDLWRYDASSANWTFITGNTSANQDGAMGTLQVPSPYSLPSSRQNAVNWIDSAGNLWLFGGQRASNGLYLNDLWRFSPGSGNWTWMGGSDIPDVNGSYGLQGIGDVTNIPGSRTNAVAWTDSSGAFWLHGGFGYAASGVDNYLNDLWRYDPGTGEWAWINGSTSTNQTGNYGTTGVPAASNMPGARYGAVSWVDNNNDFWMYGGYGYSSNNNDNHLADLWKYDLSTGNWTYVKGVSTGPAGAVFGTQGTPSTINRPGSIEDAASWSDGNGNLWMFGGDGAATFGYGKLNCVWRYNISTNIWTWMKGSNLPDQTGDFGNLFAFNASNNPGGRTLSAGVVTSDGEWITIGGFGFGTGDEGYLTDVWEYDPSLNQWSWRSGSTLQDGQGSYNIIEEQRPGSREGAATWRDANGDLWMFGGYGYSTLENNQNLNDLWKYSPSTREWTFIRGWTFGNQKTIFTHAQSVDEVTPGARRQAQSWVGPNGNFWLFGGTGASESNGGLLNDLWMYDPAADLWTPMKGDITSAGNVGIYGTIGVADSANNPGGRETAVTWVDSAGNFWMFGGDGYGLGNAVGRLNDLWKYDVNTGDWTWMSGSSSINQSGSFGTLGVPSSSNVPRSREEAVGWVDNSNDLWLFGGLTTSSQRHNDLWRYDISTGLWTWMDGGTTSSVEHPDYGTKGVFAASNAPGRRNGAAAWTDGTGKFWLFGGFGSRLSNSSGYLNDLWAYDPGLGQWAWMQGTNDFNPIGVYGTQREADTLNTPGGRFRQTHWEPVDNKLWMYGGYGSGESPGLNYLSDLWSFVADSCNLSVSATSITDLACFGDSNGSITILATGGIGAYSYAWATGDTTTSIDSLMAGNYAVTVSDSAGCQTVFSATVSGPSNPLDVSISTSDVLCAGDSTGSATAMPSGGTLPYSFAWNTSASGPNLNDVAAGTYDVTVTDGNGCMATESVVVSEPAPLNLTTLATGSSCSGTSGSASVSSTGGTGVVSYLWSTTATGANISGVAAGTYYVTGTDVNACTSTDSVVVVNSPAVSVTANGNSTTCAAGNDGTAMAAASGGTGSFTYNWSNGATGNNISTLTAGTYTVTVTDGLNCSATDTVNITSPAGISITTTVTNVQCPGGNDGSITAAASGTTGAAIYIWSNGGFGNSINTLTANTYTVTVTDANACSAVESLSVTEPTAISINVTSANDPNCFGGSDGSASVSANGGAGGFTYLWSNGSDSSSAASLSAGTYTVTATDNNGCTNSTSITLSQPTNPVSINIDSLSFVSCNGEADGVAVASASGGTGTFNFNWSNGASGNAVNTLEAGTYTVTATDGNGCEASTLVFITEPDPLNIDASSNSSSCSGSATGSVSAAVSGGTSPYTYAWSNNGSTPTLNALNAGLYTVTVTDDRGCTSTDSALIGGIQITLSGNDVTCNGGMDGSAVVNAIGGSSAYSYTWSNGATTPTNNGLVAGTYTVTVSDTGGCSIVDSIQITQPVAMNIFIASGDILCHGDSNGLAAAVVIGGVGTKTYAWSNGSTSASINGLLAGTYSVTVTDQDACTATAGVSITEPGPLTISFTTSDASCDGTSDGSILSSVSGGSGPLTYSWSNSSDSSLIENLSAGVYTLTVTDSTNCSVSATDTVSEPDSFIDSLQATSILCFGDSTGSATIFTSGTGISYQWSNGDTTGTTTGLTAGVYTVTATDNGGCSLIDSINVEQPSTALSASISSNTSVLCFGDSTGTLVASAVNGAAPFSFQWSNGGNSDTNSSLSAGIYSVTITDINGCSASEQATVGQPTSPLSVDIASTSTLLCAGDSSGAATAIALGGTGSNSYNWSNGASTASINNLTSGIYSVTVTDANGCSALAADTISEPSSVLTLSLNSTTDATCFGTNTGGASAVAAGGNGSISYLWSNGANTPSVSGLFAGPYAITATDSAGCQASLSLSISEPAALNVVTSQTNILCTGSNTGAASAQVTNGSGTINYIWSNFVAGDSIDALIAGNYTVTATDANGCSSTATVSITEPAGGLTASVSTVSDVSCFGGNDGALSVSASGGNGSLAYVWSTGSFGPTLNNQPVGGYTVTVTDGNGCTAVESGSIAQPTSALSVTLTTTDVLCFGNNTGVIEANTGGGTNPMSFNWSSGSTVDSASSLLAGTYTVTITDGNGCTVESSATVDQPASAVSVLITNSVDLPCFGGSTGSLTSAGSGGTGVLSYAWSNSVNGLTISSLTGGTYTVTATDANGCTATATGTVQEPSLLTTSISTTPLNCSYDSNAIATAAITGGTGPFSYQWSNTANTQIVNGLPQGTYTVTVTDANGCSTQDADTLEALSNLTVVLDSVLDANCFGETNGFLAVTAMNGVGSYSYTWSNGGSTDSAQVVAAGNYTVSVTDNAGCIGTFTGTVSEPTELITSLTKEDESCMGSQDGLITADVSGSVPPYEYAWNDPQSQIDSMASNLAPGAYQLTVTDAQGCSTTAAETIDAGNALPQPDLGADTTIMDGSAFTLDPGTFASYLWGDGSTNSTLSAPITGTYSVQVFDQNGCEGSDSVTITIWPTGISYATQKSIQVYPNPTRDIIHIKGINERDYKVSGQILDSKGQVVSEFELTEDSELSLGDLARGTYSVMLLDRGTVKTFRVVLL